MNKVAVISRDLQNVDRQKVAKDFREKKFNILISSDVLARGIDIPAVDLVINWDVPMITLEGSWKEAQKETYLHRIGRTGRFGTEGVALTLKQGEYDDDFMNQIIDHYKSFKYE